ncbi:hypothetical protein HOY80DRAFT_676347 [Tuber brumale]|nr:hypothetical protein HOY80DRAFT_676347 [Tuber brumale]
MFPPGRGNDKLDVGEIYLISLFGTNEMLTAVGEGLCLREYQEGHWDQMWVCEMNSDYQIGMRNRHTGRYLGRKGFDQVMCFASNHCAWEWLTFTGLSMGGYSLRVGPQSGRSHKLSPVHRVDSSIPYLKLGETCTQFGLHRLRESVFRRFEWVVPGRLARSSAPYFDGEDSDENINETSIEFLRGHQIKNIISLNSVELSPRQRGRLRTAGISYSHIGAVECTAITQEQFDQVWNAYHKAGVTIVYCGYGDGRTGMAISAIQLFQGRILSDLDYRANGVQCTSQIEALDALGERLHSGEPSSGPLDTSRVPPPPYTALEKKKS